MLELSLLHRRNIKIVRNENLEIMLLYLQIVEQPETGLEIVAHLTIVSNPISFNQPVYELLSPRNHKSRCMGFTRLHIHTCCFPFLC